MSLALTFARPWSPGTVPVCTAPYSASRGATLCCSSFGAAPAVLGWWWVCGLFWSLLGGMCSCVQLSHVLWVLTVVWSCAAFFLLLLASSSDAFDCLCACIPALHVNERHPSLYPLSAWTGYPLFTLFIPVWPTCRSWATPERPISAEWKWGLCGCFVLLSVWDLAGLCCFMADGWEWKWGECREEAESKHFFFLFTTHLPKASFKLDVKENKRQSPCRNEITPCLIFSLESTVWVHRERGCSVYCSGI